MTSAVERMRIDSVGALTFTAANNGQIIHSFKNTDTTAGSYAMTVEQWFRFNRSGGGMNAAAAKIIAGKEREWIGGASNQDGYLAFHTMENETAAERMRIVSQGRMRIRCEDFTADPGSSNKGVMIGDSSTGSTFSNGSSTGFSNNIIFMNGNGVVGKIETNGSSTTYNESSSDRTLKKNFENWTEEVLPIFKNLNPQKFNFLTEDDSVEKTKGFIAQDLTEHFPRAYPLDPLTGKYNYNPGGMVVYLMKALQEEIVKREALEARISALEGS